MRSFKTGKFTDYMWNKSFNKDKDLKDRLCNHWNRSAKDNLTDLFGAFYKHESNYTENPDTLFKSFFDAVKDTKDFKESIDKTKNNPILSYFATKKMSEEMDKMMESAFRELKSKQQEMQNAPDKVKQDAMQDAINKQKDMIRAYMRHAVKETQKEVEEVEGLIHVVGIGNEKGEPTKIEDIQTIIDLSKSVLGNPFFAKIIEMAGRNQRKAHTVLMTKCKGLGSPVGVDFGNDITKLIPSEYAMMDDPDTENLFWKKFFNEELAQWDEQGEEAQETGPVIICLDQSGSMYGQKHQWSMAVVFGMWVVCKKQKRPLYIVPFDTMARRVEIKSEMDIIDFMKSFMGGGTSFDAPLIEATNIMKTDSKFEKADMIFVTDGVANVTKSVLDEILEYKKKISFKILGVTIGCGYSDEIKKFCDKVFNVYNLNDPSSNNFIEEAFSI